MTLAPIYFGTPNVIAGPIPHTSTSGRERIQHRWIGADGTSFNLTDRSGNSGVILLYDGIDGLNPPEPTHYLDTSETMHGAKINGVIFAPRTVVWPLFVYQNTSSAEWVKYDRKVWDSLREDREGIWEVTAPGANTRRLSCVLKGVDPGMPRDPAAARWARYGVTLLAPDPFWTAHMDPVRFELDEPRNFLGGGPLPGPGAGTPLAMMANANIRGQQVPNPGDVASWVKWKAVGPHEPGLALGVSGRYVVIDRAIPEGSVLTVDTDPNEQIIMLDGQEYLPAQRARYAPIPAGREASVTVAIVGGSTGYVEASLTPRFRRAW